MKIAIDGYELNHSFTGVGRFLRCLISALAFIDRENTYTLFLKENFPLPRFPGNVHIKVLESTRSHTKWQNSELNKALNSGMFDLFYSPNHSVPFFYRGLSLMTFHDVSWKGVPEDFSLKEKIARDIKTRMSIRKCPLIFTISEFSRNEIKKYYNVPPERIIPVHHGIEEKFKRSSLAEIGNFRNKYNLGNSGLIGFLGSMFKRRNIQDLIDSFMILEKELDIKLFLAGADLYKGGLKGINSRNIIYLERLPEEEINMFYSSLDLFVYLSDYEGFGFPPMEALSCGTASLLVESSCLGEIYRDMSFFTDRTHPSALSTKISDILKNRKEAKILVGNFEKKRRYFSWDRVAREYLKHFNKFSQGDVDL